MASWGAADQSPLHQRVRTLHRHHHSCPAHHDEYDSRKAKADTLLLRRCLTTSRNLASGLLDGVALTCFVAPTVRHKKLSTPPLSGMLKRSASTICSIGSLGLALSLNSCGAADAPASQSAGPWGDNVTVIDSEGNQQDYAAPSGGDCISSEGAECITTNQACGEGVPADVIIADDGTVIDIVCYPTEQVLTPEQIEAADGGVAQNQNGAVLVLDDAADGADVSGDLTVDANKFVVYGHGPDVSVIAGDLTVEGNNSIVRGIRVQGQLNILLNDSAIVFCVIEGDVRITGNNTHLSGCDIYGSVHIEGNNNVLNGNRIHGALEDQGMNTACAGNLSFTDKNEDLVIGDDELGGAIACQTKL